MNYSFKWLNWYRTSFSSYSPSPFFKQKKYLKHLKLFLFQNHFTVKCWIVYKKYFLQWLTARTNYYTYDFLICSFRIYLLYFIVASPIHCISLFCESFRTFSLHLGGIIFHGPPLLLLSGSLASLIPFYNYMNFHSMHVSKPTELCSSMRFPTSFKVSCFIIVPYLILSSFVVIVLHLHYCWLHYLLVNFNYHLFW